MISRKIDLTEYNDFSNTTNDLSKFNGEMIRRSIECIDMPSMSMDEYEMVRRYEELFGVKRCYNQKMTIFTPIHPYEGKYIVDNCTRCGASLLPWERHFNLCKHCYIDLDSTFYGNIPWKRDSNKLSNRRQWTDAKEIFNLR